MVGYCPRLALKGTVFSVYLYYLGIACLLDILRLVEILFSTSIVIAQANFPGAAPDVPRYGAGIASTAQGMLR